MVGVSTLKDRFASLGVFLVAVALVFGMSSFMDVGVAEAKAYTGTYEYTYGNTELWGVNRGSHSGYTLTCNISKVKGNKVTLHMEQFTFYGTTGYYAGAQKGKKTVTLKNNAASFKFKTRENGTCKAKLKIVSRNKIKVALKPVSIGRLERIPMSTNYEYKVLTRT